ncbi:MAG: WD40/YVTN/BNR-like repeat-containing protein [Phycisphaerales bacterium]
MSAVSVHRSYRIVASLVLLGAAGTSFAQDRWVKQSPYPADSSLRWATFTSEQHGYAVGEDQLFVETLDGGQTWNQVEGIDRNPSFSLDPFNNIFFLDDGVHGWVIGNNNFAHRTTDGGATWTRMTNHPAGSYYHLEFVSPSLGWTAGNGSVVRTRDGGRTWQVLTYYDEYGVVYGMDFLNDRVGMMCSNPVVSWSPYVEGIYLTADAGDTWSLVREGIYNDVALFSTSVIVAAEPGRIIRSTDGGQNWTTRLTSPDEGFGELALADEDTIAVSGFSGSVWVSHDQGATWSQSLEGVGRLPDSWGISFTNGQLGHLAGPSGWLFETNDGGDTWESMNRGLASAWSDIAMVDEHRGYAVSPSGYFARTENGGANWEPGRLEVTGPLFGRDEGLEVISIVDEVAVVVAGDGGVVFKSLDAGETWESIGYPDLPDFWINGIDFVSRDVGWVIGQSTVNLEPLLYKTTNGGQSWTRQGQGQMFGLYDCQFFDENEGWVAGSSTSIWKTEDGGATWREYEFPFTFSTPAFEIEFEPISRQIGFVLQALDEIKKTEDGGITWGRYPVPNMGTGEWPYDIVFVNPSHLWLISNQGQIFESTDGGERWVRRDTGWMDRYGSYLTSIDATSDNRLWVTGGDFESTGLILANDPPPGGIELSQTPLQRGELVTLRLSYAEQGERVFFLYSRTGIGNGPIVPQLGGLRLDLLDPVFEIGSSNVNASGVATLQQRLPTNAPLIDIYTQAVIRRGAGGADSVKSNTVSDRIQP